MTETNKIGRYQFMAEPFHCDFTKHLLFGHLGNYMLNAADFHSHDRGFGMPYLNPIHKTWVLSRLAIEMTEYPTQYKKFFVDTWIESAVRYFTNRNFKIEGEDGTVYGYGKSVWAMIDTQTRQPQNILEIHGGKIIDYIETDKECPIEKSSRVKMSSGAQLIMTLDTHYNDVDVNGHINSVKYIEHVLDLFPLSQYENFLLKRFEIAYVAESHFGDKLNFYSEKSGEEEYCIRITKSEEKSENEVETCRCKVKFVKD